MAFIEHLCALLWYSSLRNIHIDFIGQKRELVLLWGLCSCCQEMIQCYCDERNPVVSVFKMSAALLCVSKAYKAACRSKQRNGDGRVVGPEPVWYALLGTTLCMKLIQLQLKRLPDSIVPRNSNGIYADFSSVWPSLLLLIIHSGDVLCSREQYAMRASR